MVLPCYLDRTLKHLLYCTYVQDKEGDPSCIHTKAGGRYHYASGRPATASASGLGLPGWGAAFSVARDLAQEWGLRVGAG
jgi:hypothetical protein